MIKTITPKVFMTKITIVMILIVIGSTLYLEIYIIIIILTALYKKTYKVLRYFVY